MRFCKAILCSVLIAGLVITAPHAVRGNGGELKETEYRGEMLMGEDSGKIVFSARMERVMFTLHSLESKYKVIRIQIENRSKTTLPLSIEMDEMEILFENGKTLSGILNLRKHDPELWSGFQQDLREMLAYPETVTTPPKGIHNIFIFIPDPKLNVLPVGFKYRIQSQGKKPVEIRMESKRKD